MKFLTLKSPAKVNLFLEVTGKRPDGYHLLETIFAKIGIFDTIVVRRTGRPGGIKLSVDSRHTGVKIGAGPGNLAWRAADAFRKEFGIGEGLEIRLSKKIPIGAGLGGGSSNAACVMTILGRLFGVDFSAGRDHARVSGIARSLGADIPFFLSPATFCLGRGIGDELYPLETVGKLPLMVLAYPGTVLPTAVVYGRLRRPCLKSALTSRVSLHKLKTALKKGAVPGEWGNVLFNRLEEAVLPFKPEVRRLKEDFLGAGARTVLMSGSGSAVFALVPDRKSAVSLAGKIRKPGRQVFVAGFLRH
ncbi:MAG: 4-(cytidine 5'-diphospho)-2-C-methyl-D-erythritol kinase [bacterium]